jgi:hypothetical protein
VEKLCLTVFRTCYHCSMSEGRCGVSALVLSILFSARGQLCCDYTKK